MAHKPIPQELLDRLVYDEAAPSGLRWRKRYNNRVPADLAAGSLNSRGYWRVNHRGSAYKAHRLVWALHHGDPGALVVDHVDGDRGNNRLENLQWLTAAQNSARRVGRGCYAHGPGWKAYCCINGSPTCLGYFATEEEARAAYVEAKRAQVEGLRVDIPE